MIFNNKNVGLYNTAWLHSWNRVSDTEFHYDTGLKFQVQIIDYWTPEPKT